MPRHRAQGIENLPIRDPAAFYLMANHFLALAFIFESIFFHNWFFYQFNWGRSRIYSLDCLSPGDDTDLKNTIDFYREYYNNGGKKSAFFLGD
jgi:hypothetical protein